MEGGQLAGFPERKRDGGLVASFTGVCPLNIDWKKVLRGHKHVFTAGRGCQALSSIVLNKLNYR